VNNGIYLYTLLENLKVIYSEYGIETDNDFSYNECHPKRMCIQKNETETELPFPIITKEIEKDDRCLSRKHS
jgi:hypothetical protein